MGEMAHEVLATESTTSSSQPILNTLHDGVSVLNPHILSYDPSSKPAASSSSTSISDDTSSTSTSSAPSAVAGGALGIILIVVIIVSIISCVAGCIWRCCIRKARQPPAAQVNQGPASVLPQYNPQAKSSVPNNRNYNPDISTQRFYGQGKDDITMDELNASSASTNGTSSISDRTGTIPEHESVSGEKSDRLNQHESSVSPRKGYFYQDQAIGEYPGYKH